MTNHNQIAITLGISDCVYGEKVRFDKSHKKSACCVNELGRHVKYKPFCPEVAIGMGLLSIG